MSDKQDKQIPISNEELVAFLDGELDDSVARRIENRLAADSELRRRQKDLSAAWDMLDRLQDPQTDADRTQTTLQFVALAAEKSEVGNRSVPDAKKLGRFASLFACVVSAGLCGFLFASFIRPDDTRYLLTNYELVERLDEYQQIEDMDFLRELYNSGLFTEQPSHD